MTGCLLLRSARQKRMMWARPRSRMLFCNVVSGWEDGEWKRNFRIGRPTTSLCFFFRAFIFSRHCVNVRLYPDFSSSSAIFRYDTSFLVIPRSCACIPPRSTTPVVLLSRCLKCVLVQPFLTRYLRLNPCRTLVRMRVEPAC